MSKQEHDATAAKNRTTDYSRPHFQVAISALRGIAVSAPKLLDIGAGNGEFAFIAHEQLGAQVTCIDYADTHLERIRELGFAAVRLNFDTPEEIRTRAAELAATFDVVTALEFIEHIFGVDDFLTFARAVLKPWGLFVVSTPNMDYSFFHLYNLLVGGIPVGEGHHVRFFNRRRLTQALLLHGFDISGEHSHGGGVTYWDRIVGERNAVGRTLLRGVARGLDAVIPRGSSKRFSKLMLSAKKSDAPALGFDPSWRDRAYTRLSEEDKRSAIKRAVRIQASGLFRDLPGLREFLGREGRRLNII